MIGGRQITNDGISFLSELRHVENLAIYGTQLNDDGLSAIQSPVLKHLTLDGTKVRGPGLIYLRRSPALKNLVIYESLSDASLGDAKRTLPGVSIDTDDSWKYAP